MLLTEGGDMDRPSCSMRGSGVDQEALTGDDATIFPHFVES
jgi:hypothetical protein